MTPRNSTAPNPAPSDVGFAPDFCHQMLGGVSRTFALSIPELPTPLSDWVECAYLICRMIDTLEDRPPPAGWDRRQLFDQLVSALNSPKKALAGGAVGKVFSPFKRLRPSDACDELMASGELVLRQLVSFPPSVMDAIRRCTLEMADGLRRTPLPSQGDAPQVLFKTHRQLERYCHYAAGVIGVMLTRLFAIALDPTNIDRRTLHRAKRFGRGLQLTNIIKDHPADLTTGRCFIPSDTALMCGYQPSELLQPALPLRVRAAVVQRAAKHLDVALDYCLSLPPTPPGIRLFCIQPMMMALLTLERVMTHLDPTPDDRPKITRAQVEDVMTTSRKTVADDRAIRRWHQDVRARITSILEKV